MEQLLKESLVQKKTTSDPKHLFTTIHHIPHANIFSKAGIYSSEVLQRFLPLENNFKIEWFDLLPYQEVPAFAEERTTILFVCSGAGKLAGNHPVRLAAGDTTIIPPRCEATLVNTSPDLLKVLQISFDQELEDLQDFTPLEERVTLRELIQYNNQRLAQHIKSPFFQLLEDGTLDDPKKRQKFLSCLYVWSSYFQRIMFSRQATCTDKRYHELFLQHLQEEIGHDTLLAKYKAGAPISDPILKATGSWFAYKMFVLDNAGKTAIVHLVLESSGDEFHKRAKHLLHSHVDSNYFDLHAELDDGHAELGLDLLRHQDHLTYARLRDLVKEAWDMFETMMDRIVFLVKSS